MSKIAKTRLAKRKQEMLDLRKENQTITSKKHDRKCLESNPVSELISLKSQFESLKLKYDALEVENKKHLEEIGLLKDTILETQKNSKDLVQKSVSVQTLQSDSEEMIFCIECEYPAEDAWRAHVRVSF
jgi:hypothetical protein